MKSRPTRKPRLIFVWRVAFMLLASTAFVSPALLLASPPAASVKALERSAVRQGELPNGFQYVVRRNEHPGNVLELRLVVRAGWDQEKLNERENAHLVEHLVANYVNLPKRQSIWEWVSSWGGVAGTNFNAQTSSDRTVYQLSIPANQPELLDEALSVMRGWTQGASFSDEDVARERAAVGNEMGRGMTLEARVGDALRNFILNHSPAFDTSLQARFQAVKQGVAVPAQNFYERWYRPELQGIIIVGDIEPDEVEAKVRSKFADLQSIVGPAPEELEAPLRSGLRTGVIEDPDFPEFELNIIDTRRTASRYSAKSERDAVTAQLAETMIRGREARSRADFAGVLPASDLSINSSRTAYYVGGNLTSFITRSRIYPDRAQSAVEKIISLRRSIEVYGFLPSEVEAAKETLVASLAGFENLDQSGRISEKYIDSIVDGVPTMINEAARSHYRELVGSITTDEVSRWAKKAMSSRSRDIILVVPSNMKSVAPDMRAVASWVKKAEMASAKPYTSPIPLEQVDTPWRFKEYAGNPVVTEFPALGVRRLFIPENGVTVLLKPNPASASRMIILSARKQSGLRRYDGADRMNARVSYVANLAGAGGVSKYDAARLRSINMWYAPIVDDFGADFRGGAWIADFERLLRIFRATFVLPPRDESQFSEWMSAQRIRLQDKKERPDEVFRAAITEAIVPEEDRRVEFNLENLQLVDYDRAREIYRQETSDASQFIFTVDGNFDPDTIGPMVVRYLGSLPGSRSPIFAEPYRATRELMGASRTVYAGNASAATVLIGYHGIKNLPLKRRSIARALDNILEKRLQDLLREKERGTYDVSVSTDFSLDGTFRTSIEFQCDPAAVEGLIAKARQEIEAFRSKGPSTDEVADAQKAELAFRQNRTQGTYYWSGYLSERYFNAKGSDSAFEPLIEEDATAESVKSLAREFFVADLFDRFVLLPESSKSE